MAIVSVYGAPHQTPLGELNYDAPQSPDPRPSREGLLAFGNRNFAPSALTISTSPLLMVYLPLWTQT